MASPPAGPGDHVLLIGIDDYVHAPLAGCVNDIDAIERVLREGRLAIPDHRIQRLASPLPGAHHDASARVPGQPATLANIRGALTRLAEHAGPGERVFIYYSGHGKRVLVHDEDGRLFHREALVPVDYHASARSEFLFDFELNRLLRAIAKRTTSLTLILDCCHSAGTVRGAPPGSVARSFALADADEQSRPDPAHGGARGGRADADPGLGIEACHVVAACLAHELAREDVMDGVRNGYLTRALVTAIDALGAADLRTLPWSHLWQRVRADVMHRSPAQTPTMHGNPARAVFAGPPVDGDPGIPVSHDGRAYHLAAGTLADITAGAELAIYADEPRQLPALGSGADLAARRGVVRVITATPASAMATAVGAEFPIEGSARARLIEPGQAARLRCAIAPGLAELERLLARSPLLAVVAPGEPADVHLVRAGDRWFVVDDQHGTGPDAPVLFSLHHDELDCARDVLEHYQRYALPLRVARRASDLPGALAVTVLDCPGEDEVPSHQAQRGRLSEARRDAQGRYQLAAGAPVCVDLHNRCARDLRVSLFNLAATGQVQLLGDEMIPPAAHHVFWARGALGTPYRMRAVPGADRSIDRLIAIGRTAARHELGYLQVEDSFTEIVRRARHRTRIAEDGLRIAWPMEQWTAAQAIMVIAGA